MINKQHHIIYLFLISIIFIDILNGFNISCNNNNSNQYLYKQDYIVMFKKYYDINEHFKLVSEIFNSNNNRFHWNLVTRNNAATKFPSDFALVSFNYNENDEFLNSLKEIQINSNHIVKYIFQDKIIYDPLKNWYDQYDNDKIDRVKEDDENEEKESFYYNNFNRLKKLTSRITSEIPDFLETYKIIGNVTTAINNSTSKAINNNNNNNITSALSDSSDREVKDSNDIQITDLFQAQVLWNKGFTGRGVKVAVFDTGLDKDHPFFRNIKEVTDWTNESKYFDPLGHGSFIAGIIASQFQCLGFAPDTDLYIYRVFNSRKEAYTSWFLDSFNHVLKTKEIDIINFSIGGLDYLDLPFVDKVHELSASGIIVISAIGNDGPLYGTLNNPSDQLDVLGVGSIDFTDHLTNFSSRGMTTWEIPDGYGRVKPDIVTYGLNVTSCSNNIFLDSKQRYKNCKRMTGTSVSSPIVTGVISLLKSSTLPNQASLLNPGSIKQILIESAQVLDYLNIFEQGNGKLNLTNAYSLLNGYRPKVTFIPSTLDFTDCPFMWPYCTQELYHSDIPIIVNISIINGISVNSEIKTSPLWIPQENGEHLNFQFQYDAKIWPWSGYLGLFISVPESSNSFQGVAQGIIQVNITSLDSEKEYQYTVELPVQIPIIPTPLRKKRILWDQFHNLKYPSGFFPRDFADDWGEKPFDWNGDHIHTNFKRLYSELRESGYYIEVIGSPLSCFNPEHYATLLIVDPEEEFHPLEIKKIEDDIRNHGLNLVVFADWYSLDVMNKFTFPDETSGKSWIPATGGSNIPALNDLLSMFGIYLGDNMYSGNVTINSQIFKYNSGSSIIGFPKNGKLLYQSLINQVTSSEESIPILGFFKPLVMDSEKISSLSLSSSENNNNKNNNNNSSSYNSNSDSDSSNSDRNQTITYKSSMERILVPPGNIVIFGDSNCIDEQYRYSSGECFNLINDILYSILDENSENTISEKFNQLVDLGKPLLPLSDSNPSQIKKPIRYELQQKEMEKCSKVVSDTYRPQCSKYNTGTYKWSRQNEFENITWSERLIIIPSIYIPSPVSLDQHVPDQILKKQFLLTGYTAVSIVGLFLLFLFFKKDKIKKFIKKSSPVVKTDTIELLQLNENINP